MWSEDEVRKAITKLTALGVRQGTLAKAMDMNRPRLNKWLSGRHRAADLRVIELEGFIRYMAKLKLTVADITHGHPEIEPQPKRAESPPVAGALPVKGKRAG